MNNDRISFSSECENIIAAYQADFMPKANLLRHCLTLAEDALRNAGLDLSQFAMAVDNEVFFGKMLQDILDEGLIFDMLATEDDDNGVRYAATVHVMSTKNNQLGISAVATRYTAVPVEGENAEMQEAFIDGKWTIYFAFEDDKAEPANCLTCERRDECDIFAAKQETEQYIETCNRVNDIFEKMTPKQIELFQQDSAEAYLLHTFLENDIIFTDEEWKKTVQKYGMLLKLYNREPGMLAFQYGFHEPVLVHADEYHSGFLFRQGQGNIELCQSVDQDFIVDALMGDSDDVYISDDADDDSELKQMRITVAKGSVNDMAAFVKRFLNKYNNGGCVYTIPLSLNRVVNLSGTPGKHIDRTVSKVMSVARKGTPQEEAFAKLWCDNFTTLCNTMRKYLVRG